MNFISCVKWVRQGVSKSVPDTIDLNEEELQELINEVNHGNKNCHSDKRNSLDPISDEYDFANYDNEDGALRPGLKDIITLDETSLKKNLDKKKQVKHSNKDSDSEDEIIKEDDNLILVGQVNDDCNSVNVYVYNENDGDMYIHHDFILKSAPLCVEWLSDAESSYNNFCGVGEMNPVIGIWDLDIVNCIEPVFKLGRAKKTNSAKNYGHSDAVLSLSWNVELPHILCSGSVDQRALLWDLHNGKVATELSVFTDAVQSVLWNSHNSYSLLTGCADGYVRNFDCRVYDEFQAWNMKTGIECILCHPENEFNCFVATDDGKIHFLDYRKKNLVCSFKAHDREITGLSFDRSRSNVLISVSADEHMRFWNIENEFQLLHSENPKLGSLYSIDMNPNYPFLACVGGSHENLNKKIIKVININHVFRPRKNFKRSTSFIENTPAGPFEIPLLEKNEADFEQKRLSNKKRKKKSKL